MNILDTIGSFLWGFIFSAVLAAYIYAIVNGITLIPLYVMVINVILFLGIIILSIIKKNIFYFKKFKFFFILLYLGDTTFILFKGLIGDDNSSVNLNSPTSILSNNLNELVPIILLVLIPIFSYGACLFREEENKNKGE